MDDTKSILHSIDGLDIPFDPEWKSVAISLSGGADSALLCYLLCDLYEKFGKHDCIVHVISHTRMWKLRPWQYYDSQRVYNYFVKKFPNLIFQRHTNFIAPELEWGSKGPDLIDEYGKLVSGDNIEIRSFAEFVCHSNNIPVYFNAVTRNPRSLQLYGLPTRNIDEQSNNIHLKIKTHMGVLACHPFRFIEKNWVILQYKKLGIEDLLSITRSCEGDTSLYPEVFNGLDYRTYVPYQDVPICEKCFWCREKEWAIKQIY